MEQPTRQTIFAQAARKMRQDFQELVTVPHSALKGGEAERIIRRFLNDHLPKRFAAGAGFVIDKRNNISPQTDVIIYDAMNCPVYRASDEAGIYPADNVAAVVEVKSRLDKQQLIDAFEKIEKIKSLAKTAPPRVPFLVQTQTLGCVFAFGSATTLDTAADNFADLLRQRGVGHHVDIIAILDAGVITLSSKIRGVEGWHTCFVENVGGREAEGSHFGVGAMELGEDTPDSFIRILLAQLSFFRGIVDHPGFDWQATPAKGKARVRYVWSYTNESTPSGAGKSSLSTARR